MTSKTTDRFSPEAGARRSARHGREAEGPRTGEPRASAGQRDPAQGKRLFCDGGARPPVQAMIAFIHDHLGAHGVEPICKVLPIAPSTYHAHVAKRRDPARLSARARQDVRLKIEVRRVFDENFRVYGVRKVWRQLKREGFDVARCTVARLMRDMGLQGVIRGKPVKTTISDKAAPCPLDHVNRQFREPRPNVLWLSDFTPGAALSMSPSSSTLMPAGSLAGGPRARRTPASCSMRWSSPCTIAARSIG